MEKPFYLDRNEIGSGNDLIYGNKKADVQMQLRIKFLMYICLPEITEEYDIKWMTGLLLTKMFNEWYAQFVYFCIFIFIK